MPSSSLNPAPNTSGDARAPALLSLRNVVKDYQSNGERVRALNGITLDVTPGEFVALVGRSGCGKSTLLNIAGAMDLPTSGDVLVDGVSTRTLTDAAITALRREKVGFIFQSFQLLPTLTVAENVELPLLLAGRAASRGPALDRLAAVDMEEYANRFPHQLSGGQQQRVSIARALVHSPRLLLADEPTGNLDTATGNLVLNLLARLGAEQRVTVLMATHSAESTAIANTVVHMRDGHIEDLRRA